MFSRFKLTKGNNNLLVHRSSLSNQIKFFLLGDVVLVTLIDPTVILSVMRW